MCNVQGVARHWRNPVRIRVTPLDSSDALYIVFLAYTVKPMDNGVRFRHPCVGPVRFSSTVQPKVTKTRCDKHLYTLFWTVPFYADDSKSLHHQTILYNPMIIIKRVNDPTISVHYFISQPVYDSVTYRINYKHYGN